MYTNLDDIERLHVLAKDESLLLLFLGMPNDVH